MSRFIIKSIMIISFLLIGQIPIQVFCTVQVFAQMTSGKILSGVVSSTEKRQVAENKAALAETEKKIEPADKPAIEKNTDKKVQEEEQNIMEDALALLDESEEYWKKGDLESALDLLDQAYALIIETDDDTAIARQKDDLRLLISKRILAIYSSRQTVTSGKRSEIPITMNADVEKEIRSFQSFERDFFISSYHRSGLYRPMIVRELKKRGFPKSYPGSRWWKAVLKFPPCHGRGRSAPGNSFPRRDINMV
jgi:hypothetical protein